MCTIFFKFINVVPDQKLDGGARGVGKNNV